MTLWGPPTKYQDSVIFRELQQALQFMIKFKSSLWLARISSVSPQIVPLCFSVPALTDRNDTALSASTGYVLSIIFPDLDILNPILPRQACCGQGHT